MIAHLLVAARTKGFLPPLIGGQWLYAEGWVGAVVFPMFLLPLSLFIVFRVAFAPPGKSYNGLLALASIQLVGFVILFSIALVDGGRIDPGELP